MQLLELSVPVPGARRGEYVLWIELWLRVLQEPDLLPECEAISRRWRGYFFDAVRRGAEAGEFAPVADPDEVAERLIALVDGLGFELLLGYSLDLAGAHARARSTSSPPSSSASSGGRWSVTRGRGDRGARRSGPVSGALEPTSAAGGARRRRARPRHGGARRRHRLRAAGNPRARRSGRRSATSADRSLGIRTELNAGFAADGYARVSGRPAPLVLSTGPGALISLAR